MSGCIELKGYNNIHTTDDTIDINNTIHTIHTIDAIDIDNTIVDTIGVIVRASSYCLRQ